MLSLSSISLDRLRGLPRFYKLASTVECLLKDKADRLRCITLFGSMAKGTYDAYSDYDLFIVVDDEEEADFLKRLDDYLKLTSGGVQLFVYTESEVVHMMKDFHTLLLDALKDGVSIYDMGLWGELKERLDHLMAEGVLKPLPKGWDITL